LNSVKFKERSDLHFDAVDVESIFVELLNAPNKMIVGCVYRPPDSDIVLFNSALDNLLSTVNSSKYLCSIAGDFNIDLLKTECHPPTLDFANCLFSHSFYPVINKPTRITETTATLIDNILTNFDSTYKLSPFIFCSDISDHLPLFF